MNEQPPTTRKCRKCDEVKPFDQFVPAARCHWGRSHQCRACAAATTRKWKDENPERRDEGWRQWAEHSRTWRKQNPKAQAAINRARLAEVAEAERGRHVEIAAAKRGSDVVERVFPLIVLERDDGVCGICGEDVDPFDFELDHIVACFDGGEHSYDNIQLVHGRCNRVKEIERRKVAA